MSALLERVIGALFGGPEAASVDPAEARLLADTLDMVVDIVEPRVKLHGGYRERLSPCVRVTIDYLRSLATRPGEPLLLSRAAWSEDARVNAFFATPQDLCELLGRSRELREFFAAPENAQLTEAYALLGMKYEEKTVFGTQLRGESLTRDVAQVAVSFSEHRLIAPSRSRAEVLREIGRRTVRALAQFALSNIIERDRRASRLQRERAYLAARLRLLTLAREGMQGVVEDPASLHEQIAQVEERLARSLDDYMEAKAGLSTLEGYMDEIHAVFAHPEQHMALTCVPLRLSRMGIKLEGGEPDAANEIVVAELWLGGTRRGVVAIARCPRAEMPPEEDLLANAERYL